MRNVTITLDEETARWARIEAARRDVSLSELIRRLLGEYMDRNQSYEAAGERFLSRPARALSHTGDYPTRAELHDRADLR